jgi:hypothetical protein
MSLNPTFRRSALAATAIGLSLLGSSAFGQDVQKASQQVAVNSTPQATSLAEHCDDIKMVFDLSKQSVGFSTTYQRQLDGFFAKKCDGGIPLPTARNDIKNFNTASEILYSGARITLTR